MREDAECRNCGDEIYKYGRTGVWLHRHSGYSNCQSQTLAEPRVVVTDADRERAQRDHDGCERGLHSWTDHLPGRTIPTEAPVRDVDAEVDDALEALGAATDRYRDALAAQAAAKGTS